MKRDLIYLVIILAVFGGLLLWNRGGWVGNAGSAGKVAPSTGVIVTKDNTYNFGTISMQDGKVEHLYQLKNNGQEPVILGELYTSCMCTSAQVIYPNGDKSSIAGMRGHGSPTYLNKSIAPGESFQVRAIFDPAAHGPAGTGAIHRIIYLATNSQKTPKVELDFNAVVTS